MTDFKKYFLFTCFFILAVIVSTYGVIQLYGVFPNKPIDGFIALIATFIGIMVTFAIGFQIYNALDLKKEI